METKNGEGTIPHLNDPERIKKRLRARKRQQNIRLREKGLVGELAQCRLCLAMQIPGIKFCSIRLKEIAIALKDMYGIEDGGGRLSQFTRICPTCKFKVQECYKFYCQVNSSASYISKVQEELVIARQRMKARNDEHRVETISSEGDAEIEYVEDHVMFDDESELFDNEPASQDTNNCADLDFDFTDEEKEDEDVIETTNNESVNEETAEKPPEEEPPAHEAMVNILLDSCVSGIESEIDCCLIDKNALKPKESEEPQPVRVVVIDSSPPKPEVNKYENPPKRRRQSQKIANGRSNDYEYIVCEQCKTIYPRSKGSELNRCHTCGKVDTTH